MSMKVLLLVAFVFQQSCGTIFRRLTKTPFADLGTECPICFEAYDSAQHTVRFLPCRHKLCNLCFSGLRVDSTPIGRVLCPICRSPVPNKLDLLEDRIKVANALSMYAIVISRSAVSVRASYAIAALFPVLLLYEGAELKKLLRPGTNRNLIVKRIFINGLALAPVSIVIVMIALDCFKR